MTHRRPATQDGRSCIPHRRGVLRFLAGASLALPVIAAAGCSSSRPVGGPRPESYISGGGRHGGAGAGAGGGHGGGHSR